MFPQLGWDDHFAQQLNDHTTPTGRAGRICGQEKGLYRIWLDPIETVFGSVPGRVRAETLTRQMFPAVGDWVWCEPAGNERWLIRQVFARRSTLVRRQVGGAPEGQVIASNVDVLFVVVSANADLNLNRLDRYLTLAREAPCLPVILLTKIDLVDDPAALLGSLRAQFPGVAVHGLSTLNPATLAVLQPYLVTGKTAALVGSSGVGKSTLTNLLIGEERLKTHAIREADARGRHTTTARHMLQLPGGALIVDTPGMRELHLLASEDALAEQFSEIQALIQACRFGDCQHRTEPECAVREALDDGRLATERWENFVKLQGEIRRVRRQAARPVSKGAPKTKDNAKWKTRKDWDE